MMKKMTVIVSFILLVLMVTLLNAQDWANFNRYKDQNEKLKMSAADENRVVFMGNSITDAWVNICPDFFSKNPFIGRGISGQTTPQMLVRFRADVIDLKPAVVVILAGTNDIAGNTGPTTLEEILGHLISMTELAQENNIKVVLSSVLPANRYSWRPELKPADKIIALNKMIKDYAEKNNIGYLDYYSPMVDDLKGLKAEFSNDGVHPTKAGYDVMMPLAKAAIKKALSCK